MIYTHTISVLDFALQAERDSIIHTFDFCTVKFPLLSFSKPVIIQNLQPLTLAPFFFFQTQSTQSAKYNWKLLTSDLGIVVASSDWSESVRSLGRLLSCWTRTQLFVPLSFSSCVNCLALWCSLNLSGHCSPPSASTSRPSSLFALFHLALCLAPSPHNSVLSQQITASHFAWWRSCLISFKTVLIFFFSLCRSLSTHDLILFPVHFVFCLLAHISVGRSHPISITSEVLLL